MGENEDDEDADASEPNAYVTQLACAYIHEGLTDPVVLRTSNKMMFVEFFCGTGHVSAAAASLTREKTVDGEEKVYETVMAIDLDPRWEATTLRIDLNDRAQTLHLEAKFSAFMRAGGVIVAHASPPCNGFSQMATVSDVPFNETFRAGVYLVDAARTLMLRYVTAWSLENPKTGRLFDEVDLFEFLVSVHYCQYAGHASGMQKQTCLAFSHLEAESAFRPHARECSGGGLCKWMHFTRATQKWSHPHIDTIAHDDRVAIPTELASLLTASLTTEAIRLRPLIAEEVARLLAAGATSAPLLPREQAIPMGSPMRTPKGKKMVHQTTEEEPQEEDADEEEEEEDPGSKRGRPEYFDLYDTLDIQPDNVLILRSLPRPEHDGPKFAVDGVKFDAVFVTRVKFDKDVFGERAWQEEKKKLKKRGGSTKHGTFTLEIRRYEKAQTARKTPGMVALMARPETVKREVLHINTYDLEERFVMVAALDAGETWNDVAVCMESIKEGLAALPTR